MARRPRVHYPGGLYHVIARGNRGHKVFRRAQDYRVYLKFLEEYKERSSGGSLQYDPESGGGMRLLGIWVRSCVVIRPRVKLSTFIGTLWQ